MAGLFQARQNEHERVEALLSEYLDGRASAAERSFIEEHVRACPTCSRSLAALQATVAAVRAMPKVHAPRSFALDRSYARKPASAPWLYPFLRAATAVAVLALCLTVVGDYFTRGTASPATSVAREVAPHALQAPQAPAPAAGIGAASVAPSPAATQAAAAQAQETAAPPSAAEAPTEAPLGDGGGAGGGGAGGLGAGGPGAAATSAPAAPALTAPLSQADTTTPTEGIRSLAAPTETAPGPAAKSGQPGTRAAAPTQAPAANTQPAQPPAPQQPEAGARGQAYGAQPPAADPFRAAEIALATLGAMLGVATLIARRRAR